MPNSKPKLRVGLIGTGFMGKAHAFGFTNAARVFDLPVAVELHTVADIDEKAARSAAAPSSEAASSVLTTHSRSA